MSEEHVFILDIGSSSVKGGYSGEDSPSYVFPSTLTKAPRTVESMEEVTFEGFTNLGQVASNTSHPIHRGLVRDWTLMEKMWENIRDTANLHDLDGTSVMLIESILTGATDNLKWAELLFETAKAPSICISSSPPLSVYASGRTCGLAVEFGAGLTSVVPVFEGFSLKHAVVTANFGGQDISASLKKLFGTKNVQIDLNSAKIVKEKLAFVKGFSSRDMHQTTHEQMTFCLPDGNDVTIETRIFRDCADPLFVPGKPSNTPNHVNYENIDIVSNIHESIVLCDESVRKDLSQNIIISGGTSLLPGLGDRLQRELPQKFLTIPDYKVQALAPFIRVIPNSQYREPGYTLQRKHAAWIGGSLLSSFDTYHTTLKITRQEWEENPEVVLSIKNI